MPRFSRELKSEFYQAAAIARDTQDAGPLADFLLANQDRMPQWAIQEAERTVGNIGVARAFTEGEEGDLPEGTTAVYSLVRFETPSEIEGGEPEVRYRTIVTRFEEEANIEEVLSNIEATLSAWEEATLPGVQGTDVVSVWQVSTGSPGEMAFPLGSGGPGT